MIKLGLQRKARKLWGKLEKLNFGSYLVILLTSISCTRCEHKNKFNKNTTLEN